MKCITVERVKEKYEESVIAELKKRAVNKHLKECSHCRDRYNKIVLMGLLVKDSVLSRRMAKLENILVSICYKLVIVFLISFICIAGYIYFDNLNKISGESKQIVTTEQSKNTSDNGIKMYIEE